MTREEIIKGLENYIPWADEYEVDIEVLTGALELLKQEPCGDAISRQAVIDLISKFILEIHSEGGRDLNAHTNDVLRQILRNVKSDRVLPPVNPQKNIVNNGTMNITL